MLIDFSKMEEQVIPGFLGGEGMFHARMRVDELGKIMRAALEPGSSIGLHTHDTSSTAELRCLQAVLWLR